MKSLISLGIAICIILPACNNEVPASEVPSIVMNAFKERFSNAVNTEWEKEKELFEAEFKLGTTNHAVRITPQGRITMHKQEVGTGELPHAINTLIRSDFKKYRLEDAEKMEINGKTYYQLEFDGNMSGINKVFNPTGGEDKTIPYWD